MFSVSAVDFLTFLLFVVTIKTDYFLVQIPSELGRCDVCTKKDIS